jgi:hypothetical protein
MDARPRRRVAAAVPVAALSFLALCACDAGDRARAQNASTGPQVFVTSPRMDQVLPLDDKATGFEVAIDLRNYEVGKVDDGKNGQHLHVILDDNPYQACYDASKAFRYDLTKDAAKTLTEGTHVLRVFPSAGPKDPKGAVHHESRKNPGAFAWVRFHVKSKGGPLVDFDGSKPLLTYSRPKGEYVPGTPEATRLLLDFYVTGCTLSKDGYKVRATVDGGSEKTITEWKADYDWRNPYFLEPTPPAGPHKVAIELLDADGKRVEGPFNRTERTITIK